MSKIKNNIYSILIGIILLLGIFLRTNFYISAGFFNDEDCRLACSMFDFNLWQILGPLGAFYSSPVFMFLSKIIAHFSGYSEYALKFIPFVSSIAGFFMFYKLCREFFTEKISCIFALFLFAVNTNFIYCSAAFNNSGLEILIVIFCLYYFPKINITELNKKPLVLLSAAIALLPLISLSSLFYIAGFLIINIYTNRNNKKEFFKKLSLILIPFSVVMTSYFIFNIYPTMMYREYIFGANPGQVSLIDVLSLIMWNLEISFSTCKNVILPLIFIIASFGIIFINKNQRKTADVYSLIVLGLVILASFFQTYSVKTAIFVIPVLILLIIKPLDISYNRKIIFYPVLISVIAAFSWYFTPQGINEVYTCGNAYDYAPKTLMQTIAKSFSPKTDLIIMNEATAPSYYFYAKKYKLADFEKVSVVIQPISDGTEKHVYDVLNKTDTNKNHWIYIVKDYDTTPCLEYITNWVHRQNIKVYQQEKNSYLYFITPPYVRYE